jgi:hypothetical protein
MDLEETEARNNCAGEGQQQFQQPTEAWWQDELNGGESPVVK